MFKKDKLAKIFFGSWLLLGIFGLLYMEKNFQGERREYRGLTYEEKLKKLYAEQEQKSVVEKDDTHAYKSIKTVEGWYENR